MAKRNSNGGRKTAKVLIVDDHPVVREGLRLHFTAQPDLKVCGEAEDVAEALALVDSTKPDVAIVDISLKTGNGIDLIHRLKARNSPVAIVVWSMFPENVYAQRALRAGAMAYVNKCRPTQDILRAVRNVLQGKVYLSEDVSAQLLARLVGRNHGPTDGSPMESLSDRELEVFELMGRGLTTQQLATRMHLSPKTIETYRARIKDKLKLSSMTELIQQAARWVMEIG